MSKKRAMEISEKWALLKPRGSTDRAAAKGTTKPQPQTCIRTANQKWEC